MLTLRNNPRRLSVVKKNGYNMTYPALEVNPTVGLKPMIAFRMAGLMTLMNNQQLIAAAQPDAHFNLPLPSVSVPREKAIAFAPTPTALPELLPPGFRVRLYALRH